jgi:hypothetical protein
MAKWRIGKNEHDVKEDAMLLVATDKVGMVKIVWPVGGDSSNTEALRSLAEKTVESHPGTTHVAFVKAEYILSVG